MALVDEVEEDLAREVGEDLTREVDLAFVVVPTAFVEEEVEVTLNFPLEGVVITPDFSTVTNPPTVVVVVFAKDDFSTVLVTPTATEVEVKDFPTFTAVALSTSQFPSS